MINFLWGSIVMYLLGIILHIDMLESTDEEESPNAPIVFALMWPYIACAVIFYKVIGLDEGDKE